MDWVGDGGCRVGFVILFFCFFPQMDVMFVLTAFCCKDWKVSPSKHRVGLGKVILKILRGRVCNFFLFFFFPPFKWIIFREK